MTAAVLVALAVSAAAPLDEAPALGASSPSGAMSPEVPVPGPLLPPGRVLAPPEPPGESAPPPYGHTGWRHELDLGAHSTTFSSKEGSRYQFHSATLGYAGSYGVTGPFLRIAFVAPLQASQDGTLYATANYYRHRYGGDLLLGVQHRWTVRGAELEAGPGFHGTLIYLPARAGYRDFSALPLGLGLGTSLRWRTRYERLSRVVTLGATASVAYDFRDPAHADDLSRGFTFRVGFAVGLGARR